MPANFFDHLQSPLIRIILPAAADNSDELTFTAIFRDNNFSGLFFVQPYVESQKYRGALIQIDSPVLKANVTLERNTFTDVKIMSKALENDEASLIYIDGASVVALNNTFELIGRIETDQFTCNDNCDNYENTERLLLYS